MMNSLTRLSAVALLFACPAVATPMAVYYSETGFGDTVSRLNVGSDITTATADNLVSIPNQDPRAIAIDHTNLKVYYANGNAIWKANLDGTGQALVTTTVGGPLDIEIDSANTTLYDSTDGIGRPAAIALDPDSDDVFFTVGGTMYQGSTDGLTTLTFKEISGSTLFNIGDIEVAVPEPSSLALLGFAGLAVFRRRR